MASGFIEVAHGRGFAASSTKPQLTRSATSLLVREFECRPGLQAQDRSTRQASMKAAGEEFPNAAERILADLTLAVLTAQDLVRRRRGRVTAGAAPLLAEALPPLTIARHNKAHPDTSLRLLDLRTERVRRHLESADMDISFGVLPGVDTKSLRLEMLRRRLAMTAPGG